MFWPCHMACGTLVRRPGIKLASPAVEAQSPNHWTTREVLKYTALISLGLSFSVHLEEILGYTVCE